VLWRSRRSRLLCFDPFPGRRPLKKASEPGVQGRLQGRRVFLGPQRSLVPPGAPLLGPGFVVLCSAIRNTAGPVCGALFPPRPEPTLNRGLGLGPPREEEEFLYPSQMVGFRKLSQKQTVLNHKTRLGVGTHPDQKPAVTFSTPRSQTLRHRPTFVR